MKCFLIAAIALGCICACNDQAKTLPQSEASETTAHSDSVAEVQAELGPYHARPKEENKATEDVSPYLENRLRTGAMPYGKGKRSGHESEITVQTSSSSQCDVVVVVKHNGQMVRNAYIEAGDSYTFNVSNGTYQVFFYSGKGWNPNKQMPGGYNGGFVTGESFTKDSAISLEYEEVGYRLIPQRNGNFSTQPSDPYEVF